MKQVDTTEDWQALSVLCSAVRELVEKGAYDKQGIGRIHRGSEDQ